MTVCSWGRFQPPMPERSGGALGRWHETPRPTCGWGTASLGARPGSQVEAGQGGRGVGRGTGVRPRAGAAVTIAQSRERFLASLVHGIVSYTFPKTEHIFLGQQVAETHKCNPDTLDIKRTTDTNISDSILCNLPRYKTSYQQVLTLRKKQTLQSSIDFRKHTMFRMNSIG